MPPSIVEKVGMYLHEFCCRRYGWDNQDWRLRWRIIHTIQTWFLASWFLVSWRILKSSSLQVSAAKGFQLIDVNFWVLLRMATTTVDSSMHSLDRSAVSNVGDGWQEAASAVESVLPGKWMIWKNQDRVLCFSQKNLVLRILLRVLSPSILTRVLWSVATSNWWQPSVKTFFFLRAHVIASAYPSSRALCCSAKGRKRDQAIVMRQPSEQQSGLNPLKL